MSPILIAKSIGEEPAIDVRQSADPNKLYHAVNINKLDKNLGQLVTVDPTPRSMANQIKKQVKFVVEARPDAIADTPMESTIAGPVFEIYNETLLRTTAELAVLVS